MSGTAAAVFLKGGGSTTAEEGDINLYNLRINPSGFLGKLLILVSWPNIWPVQPASSQI